MPIDRREEKIRWWGVSLLTRDTSPQIFGQFKSEIHDKMYPELKFMIYAPKLTQEQIRHAHILAPRSK
jgi:hypothetical protein